MSLVKEAVIGKIVRIQLLVGAFGASGLVLFNQIEAAASLAYGVVMMVVNAVWLAKRLDRTQGMGAQAGKQSIYAGVALRFLALITALIMAYLAGLHLLMVAAGMFLAQAVIFISALVDVRKEYKGGGFG